MLPETNAKDTPHPKNKQITISEDLLCSRDFYTSHWQHLKWPWVAGNFILISDYPCDLPKTVRLVSGRTQVCRATKPGLLPSFIKLLVFSNPCLCLHINSPVLDGFWGSNEDPFGRNKVSEKGRQMGQGAGQVSADRIVSTNIWGLLPGLWQWAHWWKSHQK